MTWWQLIEKQENNPREHSSRGECENTIARIRKQELQTLRSPSMTIILTLLSLGLSFSHAFVGRQYSTVSSLQSGQLTRVRLSDSENDSDDDLMAILNSRKKELEETEQEKNLRWRKAECESGVGLALPDWIRRLDVQWPLAACGSASGTIHVANLDNGNLIASSLIESDDELAEDHPDLARVLRLLYGQFDGGGTLAIAFAENLIVESGRSGGVNIWRLDRKGGQLVSQGQIPALKNHLATCLTFNDDMLWVGSSDGSLQAFPLEDELPLALQAKPTLSWKFGESPIISLDVQSDLGLAVVSTEANVHLIDCDCAETELGSFRPPFDSNSRKPSNPFVRSVALMTTNEEDMGVVCGGSDGSLYIQRLNATDNSVNEEDPFHKGFRLLQPQHFGPVQALLSPAADLVVSVAQDGRMSVWDTVEASCLYQFVGYKVWVGSLWSDGVRLVSDGADNTVIVHNFDPAVAPKKKQSDE